MPEDVRIVFPLTVNEKVDTELAEELHLGTVTVDKVKVWDGTNYLSIDSSGRLAVQGIDVSLSTRATEETLLACKTNLDKFTFTPTGELRVSGMGVIERTLHAATSVPLGANETFVSVAEEVLAYSKITGTIFSDQPGTFYAEQSPDGTNWDYVKSYSYSANEKFGFSYDLISRYVRVRFVNGPNPQTVFRLYVYKS